MSRSIASYHMHTARCGHATGRMEEYVEAAIAAGLPELGFSDHIPMYWLPEAERDPGIAMAMCELDDYVNDVYRMRKLYPEIPIRLGLEADHIPGHEAQLKEILSRYEWDYVIGSVHFIGDWAFDFEGAVNRYADWDISELYAKFFTMEIMAAKSGLFDILGHVDLIKKFGHKPSGDLSRLYADVAAAIATTGVSVELNTAGWRKPVGEAYPNPALLQELCRQGVSLVISDDSHSPQEVAWGFDRARDLARSVGYTQLCRFAGRKGRFVAL